MPIFSPHKIKILPSGQVLVGITALVFFVIPFTTHASAAYNTAAATANTAVQAAATADANYNKLNCTFKSDACGAAALAASDAQVAAANALASAASLASSDTKADIAAGNTADATIANNAANQDAGLITNAENKVTSYQDSDNNEANQQHESSDLSTIQTDLSTAKTAAAGASTSTGNTSQAAANTAAASAASTAAASNAKDSLPSCSLNSFGDIGNCILGALAYFVFQIAATILGFVGLLFNWVVTITIFQFAVYFANTSGFLLAWGILRDVGNIMLLFGFIFMGISTILDIQNFSAKKALPGLIIFAVLLNFSLFVSEAVVDVSNALSSSFYTQAGSANTTGSCGGGTTGTAATNCATDGISGKILEASGLATIWSPGAAPINDQNTQPLVLFLLALFIFITAVVLLAGLIMLIVRAVTLAFLLIVSPLGFAAMALPPLHSLAMGWWNKLISEAFFAPVFLLLVFVSLKIMSAITTQGGANNGSFASAVATPGSSDVGIFFIFALVMGFMIASLVAAKKMGAIGADRAISFSQKAVGIVPRAGLTGAGIGARSSIGWAAAKGQKAYNEQIGKFSKSDNAAVRRSAKVFDRLAGDAVVGGFGAVSGAKFGTSRSYEEDRKHREERDQETAHAAERAEHKSHLLAGIKSGNDEDVEKALQKMSQADIEDALKNMKDAASIATISKLLSSDKFDKAMDSKEMNATLKEQLIHARFAEVESVLDELAGGTKSFADVKKETRRLTNKDLKAIGSYNPELLARALEVIDDPSVAGGTGESIFSVDQLNEMKKNESYTRSQRALARSKTIVEQLNEAVKSGAPDTTIKNLTMNAGKDIAEAGIDTLRNADVIQSLDPSKLSAIMAKNEIKNQADKDAIVAGLKRLPAADRDKIKNYFKNNNAAGWWGTDHSSW